MVKQNFRTNKKATARQDNSFNEKPACTSSSNIVIKIIPHSSSKSKHENFCMKINLLKWCDEKITYLKEKGIEFKEGYPVLRDDMLYKDVPLYITPVKYAWEIPEHNKKQSLLCSFAPDSDLFTRLLNVDTDIHRFKEYAGITGFDLSPSIFMLPIRQKFSLLISSIYDCYVGLHGIKILPNARTGDLRTLSILNHFPDDSNFIIGELGCRNKGFKKYGSFLLEIILKKKHPKYLFIYGGFSLKEAEKVYLQRNCEIIVYPDRNEASRHQKESYTFTYVDGRITKISLDNANYIGGIGYGS